MNKRYLSYAYIPCVAGAALALTLIAGVILFNSLKVKLIDAAGNSLALIASEMTEKLDVMFLDRYGNLQMLVKSLRVLDVPAIEDYLDLLKSLYPINASIAVTDETGHIIGSTDTASIGQDRSQASWFQAARRRNGVHFDDIRPLVANQDLAINLSARMLGAKGEFRGAVAIRIPFAAVKEVLDGTVQAFESRLGSPGKIEYEMVARTGESLYDSALKGPGKANLKKVGLPSVLLSSSGQTGYVEEQSFRGHGQVISGYAHTRIHEGLPGPDWSVLVRADRSAVLAPLSTLAWKMAWMGILVLLPLFCFIVWATNRLRRDWCDTIGQKAWLSALLQSFTDGVIAIDTSGTIAFMNAEAESLTGWRQEEAMGRRLRAVYILTDDASHEPVTDPIGRLLHEGRAVRWENPARLIAKDGTEKRVFHAGAPIKNDDGEVLGIVVLFRAAPGQKRSDDEEVHRPSEPAANEAVA